MESIFSLVGKVPPLNKIFMNCGILISLVSAEPIHVAISMPVFFSELLFMPVS